MSSGPDPLAAPLALPGGQVLPNRLAKSALSEQLGDRRNRVSDDLVGLYAAWASGTPGLLVTGNVMVDRRHLGEPRNVVVDDDRDLDGLRRWHAAAASRGTKVWMQLNHPGRQAMRIAGTPPVAPSAVRANLPGFVTPRELTSGEIEEIVERFGRAAAVAERAGFDGAQIHGAHGYLVSQFLSPRSNVRDDDWGGTPEKRSRFLVEVVRAVRAATSPGFAVGLKLNSADFQRGGFSEEESMAVVERLDAEGLQLLEISGGTYESPAMMAAGGRDARGERATPQDGAALAAGRAEDRDEAVPDGRRRSTIEREAYFLEYAVAVRERTSAPLMVTGGFRSAAAMRDAVSSGATDVVGLGRPFSLLPELPAAVLHHGLERLPDADPRIGVRTVDSAVGLYWHTRQLQRIGAGRRPDPDARPQLTALRLLLDNGWGAARRRRGG